MRAAGQDSWSGAARAGYARVERWGRAMTASPGFAVLLALLFAGIALLPLDAHWVTLLQCVAQCLQIIKAMMSETDGSLSSHTQDPVLILADGSALPQHMPLEAAAQPVDAVIFRRAFSSDECEAIISAVDLSQDGRLTSSGRRTARTDNSTRRAKLAWLFQYADDGVELEHGWVHRRVVEHVHVAVRMARWQWLPRRWHEQQGLAKSAGSQVAQVAHYPLPTTLDNGYDEGDGGHYDWHIDMDEGFDSMAAAVASVPVTNNTSTNMSGSVINYAGRRLSITVQLSSPDAYGGGHLQLGNRYIAPTEQGSLVVFPAYLPHRVTRVTRQSTDTSTSDSVHARDMPRNSSTGASGRHSLVMWLRGQFGRGEGHHALRTAQLRLRSLHRSLQLQQRERRLPQDRSISSVELDAGCQCHCASHDFEELCRLHRLEGMLWVHLNQSEQAANSFRAAVSSIDVSNDCQHLLSSERLGTWTEVASSPTGGSWKSNCGCGARSEQMQREVDAASLKCAAQSSFGLGNVLAAEAESSDGDQYVVAGMLAEALSGYEHVVKLLATTTTDDETVDDDGMGKAARLLATSICERFKARGGSSLGDHHADTTNEGEADSIISKARWQQVQKLCADVDKKLS